MLAALEEEAASHRRKKSSVNSSRRQRPGTKQHLLQPLHHTSPCAAALVADSAMHVYIQCIQ